MYVSVLPLYGATMIWTNRTTVYDAKNPVPCQNQSTTSLPPTVRIKVPVVPTGGGGPPPVILAIPFIAAIGWDDPSHRHSRLPSRPAEGGATGKSGIQKKKSLPLSSTLTFPLNINRAGVLCVVFLLKGCQVWGSSQALMAHLVIRGLKESGFPPSPLPRLCRGNGDGGNDGGGGPPPSLILAGVTGIQKKKSLTFREGFDPDWVE